VTKPKQSAANSVALSHTQISAVLRAVRVAERCGEHTPAMGEAADLLRHLREAAWRKGHSTGSVAEEG
jgi:hypothetical protein